LQLQMIYKMSSSTLLVKN